MVYVHARQRWKRQPTGFVEVDWSHPIAKGLRGFWVFNTPVPLDATRLSTAMNPTATQQVAHTKHGRVGIVNGSGWRCADSSLHQFGTGEFSWFVDFDPDSSAGTQVAMAKYSGAGDDYWSGIISGNATADVVGATATGGAVTAGERNVIVATRRGGTLVCYTNGDSGASVASTSAANPGGGLTVGLFGTSGGSPFPTAGKFRASGIWARGLSRAESRELWLNPYQLLRPASRRIYFGILSGSSIAAPAASHSYTPRVPLLGGRVQPGAVTHTYTGRVPSFSATKYNRVDATDYLTGRSIMVLVPNGNSANPYNAANPTKCIIYAHGVGETQDALVSDSLKTSSRDALLDAGYILAGTNDGGWGAQAAVNDYSALSEYLRVNYNIKGFGVWAQSMGGLSGLLALSEQKIVGVVGWLGTYPICSLDAAYNGTGGTNFSSSINAAYGITGSGIFTYAHQTYGHDPALKWGSAFRSMPMRFYASASDTTVGKTQNSDALKTLVAASCRESTVVVCSGNHGDPSHFVPSEYVAFFDRCFATAIRTTGDLGRSGARPQLHIGTR